MSHCQSLLWVCPCAATLSSYITHSAWSHLTFQPGLIPQLYSALLSEGNYIKHSWRPKVGDISETGSQRCDRGDSWNVILRIRTGLSCSRWDKSFLQTAAKDIPQLRWWSWKTNLWPISDSFQAFIKVKWRALDSACYILVNCLRFRMLCVITLERQASHIICNPHTQEKINDCQQSFSSIASP